jgi:hypothetical protein
MFARCIAERIACKGRIPKPLSRRAVKQRRFQRNVLANTHWCQLLVLRVAPHQWRNRIPPGTAGSTCSRADDCRKDRGILRRRRQQDCLHKPYQSTEGCIHTSHTQMSVLRIVSRRLRSHKMLASKHLGRRRRNASRCQCRTLAQTDSQRSSYTVFGLSIVAHSAPLGGHNPGSRG